MKKKHLRCRVAAFHDESVRRSKEEKAEMPLLTTAPSLSGRMLVIYQNCQERGPARTRPRADRFVNHFIARPMRLCLESSVVIPPNHCAQTHSIRVDAPRLFSLSQSQLYFDRASFQWISRRMPFKLFDCSSLDCMIRVHHHSDPTHGASN